LPAPSLPAPLAAPRFLAAGPGRAARRGAFAPRRCALDATGLEDYHCYGLRAWHRNVTHKAIKCAAQRRAMASPTARRWFPALGCNFLSGHYDMALYAALEPAVRERTLVVVTAREPLALALSLFHFMPLTPRGQIIGPSVEVRGLSVCIAPAR
jgi:hypothetical protein